MSSLSVSTSSVPPFVSCRSCSVVLPTALTTTTTRFLRAYSSATDSAARLILLGLDKLDPPNLTISNRRGSRKVRGRWGEGGRREAGSCKIWFLCLVIDGHIDM